MRKRRFTVAEIDSDLRVDLRLAYGRSLRDCCVGLHIRDAAVVSGFVRTSLGESTFSPSPISDIFDRSLERHKRLWHFLERTFNALEEPLEGAKGADDVE